MINFNAVAKLTYSVTLTKNDEAKVRMYSDEQSVSLDVAIKELWNKGKIDIYDGTITEEKCEPIEVKDAKYEEDEPKYLEAWER